VRQAPSDFCATIVGSIDPGIITDIPYASGAGSGTGLVGVLGFVRNRKRAAWPGR
jgi:hypothetical protein